MKRWTAAPFPVGKKIQDAAPILKRVNAQDARTRVASQDTAAGAGGSGVSRVGIRVEREAGGELIVRQAS